MRLDRFLCQLNMGTRSNVKELIRKKQVLVNGEIAVSPELKIDEIKDNIICCGQALQYKPFVYYMMNKPRGVVSATTDTKEKTVLDLLIPHLPFTDQKRNLVPVGRLDKDTEGLLLLTDDGALAHELLSPKKHVDKTYLVQLARPLSETDISGLEQGVDISATAPSGEREALRTKATLPARVVMEGETTILLTIHEGRYHQVKRMLQAVGNEVCALKRVCFGGVMLDEELAPGASRELTHEELEQLRHCPKHTDEKQNVNG